MEMTKIRSIVDKQVTVTAEKFQFKPVVKCLTSCVVGFLLMNPYVLGLISPFAISFVAANQGIFCVSAGAGGIIGALVFFDGVQAVRYIACIMVCILINNLCAKYLNDRHLDISVYANAFISLFVISTAILFATEFDSTEFVSIVYESVLCGIGSYVFSRAVELIFSGKQPSEFTNSECIITIVAAGIILMPFYKYEIYNFSPLGVVFALFILFCAKLKNGIGGATAGISTGISLGLGGEIGFMSAGFALAGLLSGEFSRKSRWLGVAGYIAPIIITAFIDGGVKGYVTIAEGIVACGAFMLLPDRIFEKISEKVNITPPVLVRSENGRKLTQRLEDASSAIVQVSKCVDNVQRNLAVNPTDRLRRDVKTQWCKTCRNCELVESCRNEIKNPSEETIDRIVSALQNKATLDNTHFPKGFAESCYSFGEMRSGIQRKYLSHLASLGVQGQVNQMQGLLSDQFKGMADILKEIACEFNEDLSVNTEISDQCIAEAREFGLNVIGASSCLDKYGRLFININTHRPRENFNVTRFTESISNLTGTRLDLPELVDNGDTCIFKFSQMISREVEVGAFSRSMDDVQVCGDYYQSFNDGNGRYITVLSDGMGTGSRAAVDSAMAAELFSKLVKSGLSFDCALPIANSALLVKSTDESLATLDVVCVDLYNGRTDFMKAGAAATFIRHKDTVAALEQASLPIGILRDVAFSKATAKLSHGDIILMVSDGVLGDCNGWIQQEMKLWSVKRNPNELAQFIVNSACERKLGKHRDDMTAIAIYIK